MDIESIKNDYYLVKKSYHKDYYSKNEKKLVDYRKEYYNLNRDKFKNYAKNYYWKNKKSYHKDYYSKNKKNYADYRKEYYKLNKDKFKNYAKNYYLKNKDIININSKINYRIKHDMSNDTALSLVNIDNNNNPDVFTVTFF